jgi:polyphosphate kinase
MAMTDTPVAERTPGPPGGQPRYVLSSPYPTPELASLEPSRRLLHEAEDARNPLLERLHRVAGFDARLDDLFMMNRRTMARGRWPRRLQAARNEARTGLDVQDGAAGQ